MFFTPSEIKTAELIRKVDKVHFADIETREQLEEQIEGPFSSGAFTYNDEESAVSYATSAYQNALNQLNMIGGDERNNKLGQHYQRMIVLLENLK